MNTRPVDVDDRGIVDVVRAGWGFEAVSVEYAALGFGSHHWVAFDSGGSKRFVTVDDLSTGRGGSSNEAVFARLSAAFETARALREIGLEFVVAPLPDVDGCVLRRLADSYSVAVFPFLEGDTLRYGDYESDGQRREVLDLVGRLHQATPSVVDIAAREDFALSCRSELDVALRELGRPWTGGPFAERARQLLVRIEADLMSALEVFDGLVDEVRNDATPWVVTHGEPHAANVIWTSDGPRLVDWDTARIAPAGRDLWMLEPSGKAAAREQDTAIVMYRLGWDLAEIAIYVSGFRLPHETTADTLESWKNLEHYAQLKAH